MDVDDVVAYAKEVKRILKSPKNWHKGWYQDGEKPSYCLVGACAVATKEPIPKAFLGPKTDLLSDLFAAAANLKINNQPKAYVGVHGWRSLAEWNDHPKRTHAQVLKLCDKVISLDFPVPPGFEVTFAGKSKASKPKKKTKK